MVKLRAGSRRRRSAVGHHARQVAWTLAIATGLTIANVAYGQELEPKAYAAAPIGANFLVTGFTWSHGAILLDPTIPITGVDANIRTMIAGVGHTFGVLGRLTRVQVTMP